MSKRRGKCNSCCVPGCNSNSTPSFRNRGGRITTFKLPRDDKRRKEWIQAIPKRKYPPTVNHNVCILHFNEEDFSRNNRRIDLTKSAVPSIFPFVVGQRTDESSDICDEVWTEYVAHKRDSFRSERLELPVPTTDISRILIERLRISGSKYFGIDTAEITIDPESEIESDVCEPKATKAAKPSRKKTTKRQGIASSDEPNDNFNAFDMTEYSQTSMKEHCDNAQEKEVKVESVNNADDVPGDADKFGAMVSSKLLLMTPLQRLMSQKIISEILLKGQLGMLKSSLSPVLVADYMKNSANDELTDCSSSSMCVESQDKDNESNDCDPLMFQVSQGNGRDTKLESFDFIKHEVAWSDDDQDEE